MTQGPDVAAVCERLREQGVDVVRVSYPDLIGVDRGRDVLLDELPAVVEHGLAFCRAVYHTSPMGDVVPVQGGLELGLPDITVHPDLATLAPLLWEPAAAWCLGDAAVPGGETAPESPRAVARRVAEHAKGLGYTLICGPELEFYLCEQAADGRWQRYANDPGNVYVVGRKGDPQGILLHMLRQLRDAGLRVTAANHEFSPGQFEINLASATPSRRWRPTGSSPTSSASTSSRRSWPTSGTRSSGSSASLPTGNSASTLTIFDLRNVSAAALPATPPHDRGGLSRIAGRLRRGRSRRAARGTRRGGRTS